MDIVATKRIQALPDLTNTGLTPHEWSIILAGATKHIYQKGDIITKKGTVSAYLYIIDEGILSFYHSQSGDTLERRETVSGRGKLFGEFSIFRSSLRSVYTVRVESPTAVLYCIQVPFLISYLRCEPMVAVRFFHLVCKKMTQTIHHNVMEPTITCIRANVSKEMSNPELPLTVLRIFPLLESQLIVQSKRSSWYHSSLNISISVRSQLYCEEFA